MYRIIISIIALVFSLSVTSQTVYATKTGDKYHKSNCRYLKYSKKELSLNKAIMLSYKACSVCKPPVKKDSKLNSKLGIKPNVVNKDVRGKETLYKVSSMQCTGKTKSGTRCKRKTKSASGRCYQH